jgi:hypothetical protein
MMQKLRIFSDMVLAPESITDKDLITKGRKAGYSFMENEENGCAGGNEGRWSPAVVFFRWKCIIV